MNKFCKVVVLMIAFLFVFTGVLSGELLADGTETLGPPIGLTLSSGSGVVAAGTGLFSQPGTININVPGTVQQALLYWECESGSSTGDQTITLDGTTPVTGSSIGGPTKLDGLDLWTETFRADITSLGLVGAGDNSLTVEGLNCVNDHGAGLLVIYDSSDTSDIQVRDGNDFAFCGFLGNLNSTTPQTFSFAADASDRSADLVMFFGSVGINRPNSIEITVNGSTQTFSNTLNSGDGPQWDTFVQTTINIPAGATSLTVQAFSRDDTRPGICDANALPLPASLNWVAAGLSVPQEFEGCTPGYWKQDQHFDSWVGYDSDDDFANVFGCSITIKWSERGKPQEVTNPTLLQALQAKGGGESALARHAVAALLNAASPDVTYPRNAQQVINMVCDALPEGDIEGTKNTLAGWNEEFCPLN